MHKLAEQLKTQHYKNVNGCWVTDYHNIPGLKVLASSTNGTSGIGRYQGSKLYWYFHHPTQEFQIERA